MYERIFERYGTLVSFLVMLGTYRYILGFSIERIKHSIPYVMVVLAVIISFFPYSEKGTLLSIVVMLLTARILFFCAVGKRRYRHSLVFWLVLIVMMMPSMLVEVFAKACFQASVIDSEVLWIRGILDVVSVGIISMLAYCDYKWKYTRRLGSSERYLIMAVSTVILISSSAMLNIGNRTILFLSVLLFTILIIAVVLLLLKGYKAEYYKEVSKKNERNMEELLKHFEAYQAAQEDTRRMRHDMKNHLTCIKLLLDEGKNEELKEYLEEITEVTKELSFPIATGNTIVDAILCEKAHIVKAEQIQIKVDGKIPHFVLLRPMDWCTMVANAVDNAVEAVRLLPKESEKTVWITFRQNRNFLSIRVENLCKNKVAIRNGEVMSTKQEKEQHGFGIRNIKKAVQEYQGDMRMECTKEENSWRYQLQILLPLHAVHSSQNKDDSSQNSLQKVSDGILKPSKSSEGEDSMEYESKLMKKHMNRVGLMVVAYTALMVVGTFAYVIGKMVLYMIQHPEMEDLSNHQLDQFINQIVEGGGVYLVGVAVAFTVILFYRRRQLFSYDLIWVNKRMTPYVLGIAFVCLMGIQFIFSIVGMGVEAGLNRIGYSIMQEVESASARSTTISMYLYAGLLGPIVEEILFRGAVLRSLEKYGKVFAILVSSILFGLFHGNLLQGFFAFFIGIVLAYITVEYSIKWAMLLHIINNTLGDVVSYLTRGLNENTVNVGYQIVFGVFFLIMLGVLVRKRRQIKQYIADNKGISKSYQYVFTRFWIIFYIILELVLGISGIERFAS